jgi:hypothetical protein
VSTFVGKNGTTPLVHMTSDERTEADLKSGLLSSTLFHSDLPYIFVREQWTLSSYTTWNGSSGGRKFALPADLQTFKSNNPDLAFLVVLEDGNGNKTVLNPLLCTMSCDYYNPYVGYQRYCTATVGSEYSVAFTDSDTQLTNLTRNTYTTGGVSVTFRTWDTNDTSITVFRNRAGEYYYKTYTAVIPYAWDNYSTVSYPPNYMIGAAKNMTSSGLDITKVHIMFLNVINSTTSLSVQSGYNASSEIIINKNTFRVGNIDLIKNTHLIAHGVYNASNKVTSLGGTLVGAKTTGFSYSSKVQGMVASNGVVQDNNTPVLEIPPPSSSGSSIEIDLKNQLIKRDGNTIFSTTAASKGLVYNGTKEITMTLSASMAPNQNTAVAITNTQTGSFVNSSASTLYLATLVFSPSGGGKQTTQVVLCSTGNTEVFSDYHYYNNTGTSYSYGVTWYINIATNGTVSTYYNKRTGPNGGVSGYSVNWGSITVRLIALN